MPIVQSSTPGEQTSGDVNCVARYADGTCKRFEGGDIDAMLSALPPGKPDYGTSSPSTDQAYSEMIGARDALQSATARVGVAGFFNTMKTAWEKAEDDNVSKYGSYSYYVGEVVSAACGVTADARWAWTQSPAMAGGIDKLEASTGIGEEELALFHKLDQTGCSLLVGQGVSKLIGVVDPAMYAHYGEDLVRVYGEFGNGIFDSLGATLPSLQSAYDHAEEIWLSDAGKDRNAQLNNAIAYNEWVRANNAAIARGDTVDANGNTRYFQREVSQVL